MQWGRVIVVAFVLSAVLVRQHLVWVDYEDVVQHRFLQDYAKHRTLALPAVYNDEVNPVWWKWPPKSGATIFNGAPVACPKGRQCIYVSVAAVSLFLRRDLPASDTERVLLADRTSSFSAWKARPYTLCQLFSRQRAHRVAAWTVMTQKVNKTASLSGRERNTVKIYDEATGLLQQCQFAMAMEGYNSPGYVTEKVVNALLAGAVPLYWGHTKTVTTMFNRNAMVLMQAYRTYEDVADALNQAMLNETRARQLVSAPIATRSNIRSLLWWRYK